MLAALWPLIIEDLVKNRDVFLATLDRPMRYHRLHSISLSLAHNPLPHWAARQRASHWEIGSLAQ
ncbi:MAG: hypothetical protein EA001_10630 [Oscillatoriales cyanobacterium]|nr:MAG: hypothetical protein EA001_10630 [Oscillatoriales cyanobacterium]